METAKEEKQRVEDVSSWYLEGQLDFDIRLIQYRYQTLKPFLRGEKGLELGPAEGQMTKFLINDFKELTIVDGASELLALIPDSDNLIKVHSLFEDFKPEEKYHTIIMEHILEHVDKPVEILELVKEWLDPESGYFILGVPNANSYHRLAAVKMDLLAHQSDLNPRDVAQGHRRVYTHETFRNDIEAAGLRIVEMGGTFFKPLTNGQIQKTWTPEMMDGFYKLGKDFPGNAADIYAVCQL